jgi:hypothetical protein
MPFSIQSDAEEVDAPDEILEIRASLEKLLGRRKQPSPLGWSDCLFCLDQSTPPNLDLDKDELVSAQHDQVEFADPAAPLFR